MVDITLQRTGIALFPWIGVDGLPGLGRQASLTIRPFNL
jgi:hypothetical protein